MALDRRVADLLGVGSPEALTSAVALLRTAEDVGCATPETAAPENFLLCAEGSLGAIGTTQHDTAKVDTALVRQARECVEHYLGVFPARNQFLVRAYYTLGRVQAAEAEPLKGEQMSAALLTAVSVVQKGITLAAELGATHRFLVYNGSVHVYRIARPLLTYSGEVAQTLTVNLESILKRLKETEEPGKVDADWRLQLSMELARSYARAGRKKDAAALLVACATGDKGETALADRCDASLAELMLQLQAHMLLDDAAALKKLRDEAISGPTATPRRRSLILTQILVDGGPPVDPKGPAFDVAGEVEGAVAALDPDLGAALATEGGEEAVKNAVRAVNSSSPNGCPDDDVLILLAMQAANHGLLTVADHCAMRCTSSSRLGVRVRSSYIAAMVAVGALDSSNDFPSQGNVYTRHMVSTRIDALRNLEEAMSSARRVGEPALVQDGCIIIWNTALPLLQPSLIGYAERALYLAASALEVIASPLAQLRASLHLELARLDATRDYMQKASGHVKKALALDVPADAGVGSDVNPILRPLRTLGTRLALKTDVYRAAESPEEKVIILLEQARTDRRVPLKKQLLEQTLEELQLSEPDPDAEKPHGAEKVADERDADTVANEEEEARKRLEKLRERASLWSELMRAGWALRLSAMARAAAIALLAPIWSTTTDAELVGDQADARYILGETYIDELQRMESEAAARKVVAAAAAAAASGNTSTRVLPPVAPPGQEQVEAVQRDDVRQRALAAFCEGVEIGITLMDDLAVQNGCIYVINYNRSLLRAAAYGPLLPSLRVCVGALQKCSQEAMKNDVQLLRIAAATATSLSLGLEQLASKPPEKRGGCRSHDAKDADQAASLKEGVDVCKWACELCTGHGTIMRQLTACWARLQAYTGAKEPQVGTEPAASALALLELLACGLVDTVSAGANALGKAKELLMVDGAPRNEPELWVRVAQQAMALGDLAAVVKACDSALRPLHACMHPETSTGAGAPVAAPAKASKDASMFLREEWRWFALAELVHGEAIAKLLKDGQQAALQQQLHANALMHLAASMSYSNHAAEGSLVLSAAQRFWQHVEPFLASEPPDDRLRAPVGTALAELQKLDPALQSQVTALRVRLYEVHLAVLAHAHAWAEGLSQLQSAFLSLPEASMQPLWEEKVVFMCRGGGKGLAGEMHKLKDFEPHVQAKVWAVLGQSAPTTGEQLTGMLKAVDVLSAEPLTKVPYLIALAQWLYTHDFPLRDSEDQLMVAVDILMDHEDIPDDEDDTIDDAASSIGSTAMSQSTKPTTVRSDSGSAAGSKLSRASGKSQMAPETALAVMQYEQLARIYLMRSMMAASLSARLECAFVALHYISRLWDVAVGTANAYEMDRADAKSDAPPPFSLPREVHEWVGWCPSEQLEEVMAKIDSERVISPSALPDPQLTVAHLKYAIDLLLSSGLHLHALMPLVLLQLIAKRILKVPALAKATALRIAHVLHQLGRDDKAAAARAMLQGLRPTPDGMRRNVATLRQLRQVDPIVPSAPPTIKATNALEQLLPPSRPRRKSCARPNEADWVELASLLIEEGEWAAAGEWLLEAAPLLSARGELEHESRCRRLLARLQALHGDPAGAMAAQLAAMHLCPLEVEEWVEAVLDLAQYRADAGDDRLRIETLEAAAEIAGAAAAEHPSGAVEVRLAQALILQALGRAYGKEAASLGTSGMVSGDEASAAAHAFDSAVATFFEMGEYRKAALSLVDRAAQHGLTPMRAEQPDGETFVLEAEANHLDKLCGLLTAAHQGAERAYFITAPRSLPINISLPLGRELSAIKCSLVSLQLRLAALHAKVAAANPTPGPSFPMVAGGNDETIRAFVAPGSTVPRPVHMEPEGLAQLHAVSAISLAGSGAARARALRANGEVLCARASACWGIAPDRWEQPLPPAEPEEGAPAEGVLAEVTRVEGEAPAEAPPPSLVAGVSEDSAARTALGEAISLALAESDLETAEGAAVLLARACGVAESHECAKWLSLYQACASHRHWRSEWIGACEPSERVSLRGRMVQWLPQRWVSPAALPAMQSAEAALVDEMSGSPSWRALAVPSDPLEELWPQLPAGMRVLVLTLDGQDAYATVIGALPGEIPAGGLAKGTEPPPPRQLAKVSRRVGVDGELQALLADMSSLVGTLGKAALQRSKDDLYAVEHRDTDVGKAAKVAEEAASQAIADGKIPKDTLAAAILPKTQLTEAEAKLRALVASMDATFAPLLEPLLPNLSDDAAAGGSEELSVIVIAGASLAALPLEMLTPLRRPHITAVSRDLSAPVLAWRLKRTASTACAAKKASFGGVADPRNEISVPKPASELSCRPTSSSKAKKPAKGKKLTPVELAEEAEAKKKSQGICTAFGKDVLEGGVVQFGKEWSPTGTLLLGTARVPSPAEWQRALLGSQAFVVEGPGALHEQIAPQHIAPLQLEACAACLLFDRAASDLASRRLAREANTKSTRRVALETPHAAAALLSLAGVRTVLTNQWAAASQSNHDMLVGVFAKIGAGASLCEALGACARAALTLEPEVAAPTPAAEIPDPTEGQATVAAPISMPMWTVLANPVIYGLPDFKVA